MVIRQDSDSYLCYLYSVITSIPSFELFWRMHGLGYPAFIARNGCSASRHGPRVTICPGRTVTIGPIGRLVRGPAA